MNKLFRAYFYLSFLDRTEICGVACKRICMNFAKYETSNSIFSMSELLDAVGNTHADLEIMPELNNMDCSRLSCSPLSKHIHGKYDSYSQMHQVTFFINPQQFKISV